jgi:hypothetical protein
MSNYKAIAVVTAALRNRLTVLCSGVLSAATVTTLRPDMAGAELPTVGVNIFLYQVTPNAALRNADLLTRRGDGTAIKHPTAALDLHYLLSFYGHDQNFETQILLGSVVGNLHADPSLSRKELGDVFSASALGILGAGGAATQGDQTITELTAQNPAAGLDPSGLADAVDLVRFTPTELSLEELSKLWSVFLDTPYVLSAVYQAGPVLIEDTSATLAAAALPVMLPRVRAVAVGLLPAIEQVFPATGAGTPIIFDSTLTIMGTFFAGLSTTVLIDGGPALALTLPPSPANAPQRPQLTIPGVPIPPIAQFSGAHTIQVTQQLPTGAAGASLPVNSNVAGFVLQPTITASSVAAFDPTTRSVTVTVAPAVAAHQTVRLLMNLVNPTATAANPPNASGAYVLEIAAPQADGAITFVFATKGLAGGDLPSGTYLIRIQVDGVDSPLTFVPPTPGAAAGQTGFSDPTATVTLP